jgi:hypothetical protein
METLMNEADPPTTVGVFKLVGHTLIAFHTEGELQSAVSPGKGVGAFHQASHGAA